MVRELQETGQIQDLEEEVGFKLFERLPRGVKLSAAGKLFLEDARRVLQEVSEAAARAARVAPAVWMQYSSISSQKAIRNWTNFSSVRSMSSWPCSKEILSPN